MRDGTRSVAWTAAVSYVRMAITLVALLLLTPFVLGRLGAEDFGLWTLAFSMIGLLSLLDMGLSPAVVKHVAACRGLGDPAHRNRVLSTILAAYLGLAALAGVLVLVLGDHLIAAFSIPPAQRDEAHAVLVILALRGVVLALPLGMFRGVLLGGPRPWVAHLVQIPATLLWAGLAWAVLASGRGLVTLAWANLAAMLAEHAAYVVLAFRDLPDLRLSPLRVDRSLVRGLAAFGAASFVVNVASLVLLRTDPLLVQLFLTLPAVAAYGIAMRVAEQALLLVKQFVNALSPYVAERHGAGDAASVRAALTTGTRLALGPALALAVAGGFAASTALRLWLGPELPEAGPVLAVLLAAVALLTPQLVAGNVMTMTGRERVTARGAVLTLLVNLTASVLLVQHLGLLGVALGTLTASLAVDLLYTTRTACRVVGLTFSGFLRRAAAPALPAALLHGALAAAIFGWREPASLAGLVLSVTPGLVLHLLAFYAFALTADERTLVRTAVRRSSARFRARRPPALERMAHHG